MLESFRDEIDQIDDELHELFLKRMDVVLHIADEKKKLGLSIEDLHREDAKIKKMLSKTPKEFKDYVGLFFEDIFEISKEYQNRQNKI